VHPDLQILLFSYPFLFTLSINAKIAKKLSINDTIFLNQIKAQIQKKIAFF
jgi:hypothetical protein